MRRVALVAAAVLAGVAAAASGAPGRTGTSRQPHALVTLGAAANARAAVRQAGGVVLSRRLGIWRVPAGAVRPLHAQGAVARAEREQPRRRLDHLTAGDEL